MTVRLAGGPVSWGVDFADSPTNPPWPLVLDGIARAGLGWTELGPLGYLPDDPGALRVELARRELRVAGSFVFQPLHDPTRHAEVLDVARRTCRLIQSTGGRHLVVIDLVTAERVATAGRCDDARRLRGAEWEALVDGVGTVAAMARDEFGLEPTLHPHAGSFVEFQDEVDALLQAVDLGLCLDTGHCAYAGEDPVATYERWPQRVGYLHLKDVDPGVRRRVQAGNLDFWQAVAAGAFCPVGRGVVDFEALEAALERHGFDGWATIEQDRTPGAMGDPVADLLASRRYLESVGIGLPATQASSG